MSLFLEIVFPIKYRFCSFPDMFQLIKVNTSNNMPSLKGSLTIIITVEQPSLNTSGLLLSICTTFFIITLISGLLKQLNYSKAGTAAHMCKCSMPNPGPKK